MLKLIWTGLTCGLVGVMPESWMAVFMLTFSASICAFNCGGFYKCGTLTSRYQFIHAFILVYAFGCRIIKKFSLFFDAQCRFLSPTLRSTLIPNCCLKLQISIFEIYPTRRTSRKSYRTYCSNYIY